MKITKIQRIEELFEKASESLSRRRWFEAERMAEKAMQMSRAAREFERMAELAPLLQQARSGRLQEACEHGGPRFLTEPVTEASVIEPGCYVVEPPLVGADARRFRLAAFNREAPVAVLCREPLTQLRLCPVVAIGEVTVRTRIDPPSNPAAPDMAWFKDAMETLGEAAIDALDTGQEIDRQVDAALALLDTVPEYPPLHELLAELCREAARQVEACSTQS